MLCQFFRMITFAGSLYREFYNMPDTSPTVISRVIHQLQSVCLQRTVELEFFYPDGLADPETLNLLLLNDGQDADGLQLTETLSTLLTGKKIEPLLVVAIKASAARVQEYGIAGNPDYAGRGALAGQYSAFIAKELLPYITQEMNNPVKGKYVIAGCSLGGLTAFDIAWNNADLFDAAGVFSGSFWWRRKNLTDNYTDEDRIMHRVIRDGIYRPGLKFWLMAGTEDEIADRNHNFIIDAIDDTIDIIKELQQKGYKRPDDIFYYERVGGRHHVNTWAQVMPSFLCWAFSKDKTAGYGKGLPQL
jgi:enterochelin esterase-like enzyme